MPEEIRWEVSMTSLRMYIPNRVLHAYPNRMDHEPHWHLLVPAVASTLPWMASEESLSRAGRLCHHTGVEVSI
ncbi:hypothetical protein CBM2599_B50312 [Cupriavidus taiwanensis]|nr:hypothetical protein CBM2600_B10682 [Cupriavidus taiwanensis]SOY96380.1 hypothetical protein CBM2599_B50312 [Cupriavidus taiwanensis]